MAIDVPMRTHPIKRHSALIAEYGAIEYDDGFYEKEPSEGECSVSHR
jgi:hypothetical protein